METTILETFFHHPFSVIKFHWAKKKKRKRGKESSGEQIVEEGVANFETDAGGIFEFDFPPTETRRGMISGIGRVARHNVRSVPFDTAARYR